MDYLDVGPTPAEELPEQIGPNYNVARAKHETRVWINQLKRTFPPPEGILYSISANPHDYGTYHEARIHYDDTNREHVDYVFMVDREAPGNWDEHALADLRNQP